MLNVMFRADADSQMGTGHVMRCLALAQACREAGGRGTFVSALESQALEERLRSEGMEVSSVSCRPGSLEDATQTALLAKRAGAPWVVVDGYHFGGAYHRAVKEAGLALVAIDDNGHAEHYVADLVLNQNLHAEESLYASREPETELLLGPRYVLLRQEFLNWKGWRGWRRPIPEAARRVLVTMGGADPENLTLTVVQALQGTEARGLEAVVVAGASNPNYEALRAALRVGKASIRLERNVADMPALMAWADVAVASAGTTCWELAFMGLPSLLLIAAPNQEAGAEAFSREGAAVCLGWGGAVEPEELSRELAGLLADGPRRRRLSRQGSRLVDGLGPRRVLDAMAGCRVGLG